MDVLLGAFERAGGFMKAPAVSLSPIGGEGQGEGVVRKPTEKPGDKIGRYKLLEQIGEGGCGVVYFAEQEEPVRRRVALKIIKPWRREKFSQDVHQPRRDFERSHSPRQRARG